jgi:hypothetical protein
VRNSALIGRDTTAAQSVRIPRDARRLSLYAIGTPGTGKSTLLERLAIQDMHHGDGLCFLDPHEDSANSLLRWVPADRTQDVIVWDPTDRERPIGLNPFYSLNPEEVGSRAGSFLAALSSLKEFTAAFGNAPQMSIILLNLARTFLINQGYTLAEATLFLEDEDYRTTFYPALAPHDDSVLRFWQRYDRKTEREKREYTASTLNKLERFETDRTMKTIFGQYEPQLDFRALMDEGKILIVKLSSSPKRLGPDNAALLGAFIVWELFQAALSRSELGRGERRLFHLYADEFQTFMTTTFPQIIDQGRKYGLTCVLAHQNRAQLTGESKGSTLGIRNKIVFTVNSDDAAELAPSFDTSPPPAELVPQAATEPVYDIRIDPNATSPELEALERELAEAQRAYHDALTTDKLSRIETTLIDGAFLFFEPHRERKDYELWEAQTNKHEYKYAKSLSYMLTHTSALTRESCLLPNGRLNAAAFGREEYPAAYDSAGERAGIPFWVPEGKLTQQVWTDDELVRDVSRTLNPDHRYPEVRSYVEQQTRIMGKAGYGIADKYTERRAFRLPVELPTYAETSLARQAQETPQAKAFSEEFLSLFLPLKAQAVYYWDPHRWTINPSDKPINGHEHWELTLFPAVYMWLKQKAAKQPGEVVRDRLYREVIWPLEQRIKALTKHVETVRREVQTIKRDTGLRRAVSGSSIGERLFQLVPGPQKSPHDVAAEIANQLTHLPPYIARCIIAGSEYTIKTFAAPKPHSAEEYAAQEQQARELYASSRQRFGRERADVEAEIAQRRRAGPGGAGHATMGPDGPTDPPHPSSQPPGNIFESEDI